MINLAPPDVRESAQIDISPELLIPEKLGIGEQYDLLQYVTENLDPNPIIIDADDLQNNPSSILRQYCQALGIPFNDSMLTWEKGDAITRDWIAAEYFLRINKLQTQGGFYEAALSSTCFQPSKPALSKDEMPEDVIRCIDKTMPTYQKMFENRLRP